MSRPSYLRIEYIHVVPFNHKRWEHVWPINLTNRQLTLSRIARAFWEADVRNNQSEGQ